MANLVDSFLGGVQRAAGYSDRRRQVQSQLQAQDMAATEFNNQQYDRNMAEFARRTNTAILDVKDRLMQQGENKNEADLGIEDFITAYGKEEGIKVLNSIGFGAGSLGENKFIADIDFNDDGTITPTVGVYDTDEEGNPYVYSERFTKGGKKAAEGGEYEDLDLRGANATLQRYFQGVRGAGGMFPNVAYMERTQKGAFGFGDREGAEKTGQDSVDNIDGTPTVSDSLAGENTGVGIKDPMGGDGSPAGPGDQPPTMPMGEEISNFLPQLTIGGNVYSPIESGFRSDSNPSSPAYVDASTIGEYEGYIETNPDVPFNMTQEQFNSLTTEEQDAYKYASRAITYKSIQDRVKPILMPEGSSALEGGLFSSVRNNPMDYKDGKKIAERGMSASKRQAKDKANNFYADNEDEIYSYLATNPEAFKEFEKDPQAFATNSKYTQNGKLITPAPAKVVAKNKVALKTVGKNVKAGNPTDQDTQTVAGIIAQNTNTSNQSVNMRQYGRNDRISISKTILASIPANMQGTYVPMLGVFEETGMMTLDPAKLQISQLNAQTQAQYGKEQTPSVRKYIEDQGMILAKYDPVKGVSTNFDTDDLPEFVNGLSVMIGNAQNEADLQGLGLIAGQAINLYIENEATDGILGSIKTWLFGGPNTGGFSISPNVRAYNSQGQLVTDFSQRNTIDRIGIVGEDGTRDGDFVSVGEIRGSLDQGGLDMLLGYATKAGSI